MYKFYQISDIILLYRSDDLIYDQKENIMKKKYSVRPIICILLAAVIFFGNTACSSQIETTEQVTSVSSNTAETETTATESVTETETFPTETAVPTTESYITTEPTGSDTMELPDAFPLIDSSTARIPITEALYSFFVEDHGLAGPKPICSKTHQAWLNLADGTVDLILCIEPTEEEREYLYEKGVDVEMRLYGCDALVFLGNSENPVKDLTKEQIKAIYRGEITNWSELGGPDEEIIAYYRDDQSGSQRFFEDLVWEGEELPDLSSPNMHELDGMDEITDTVIEEPYAVGFNIMSYINFEYSDQRLMIFSIDGVEPSTETLADSTYAYITQAYVIINADEPEDSSARWLFNWFGSGNSRDIIAANSSLFVIFSDPILLKTSEK
jgi:phosphate transport system substrate-binding protein